MTDDYAPRAPALTYWMLWKQALRDAQGKEVHDAITYSYVWLADQTGHIFQGFVANFVSGLLICRLLPWLLQPVVAVPAWLCAWLAPILAVLVVVGWEVRAYRNAVDGATGEFPLGRKLLRDNAAVAAFYMVLGVVLAAVIGAVDIWMQLAAVAVALVLGLLLTPPFWVRQKMIWQKGSLPYLFRLADLQRTLGMDKARALQKLIDAGAPPNGPAPRQIVIGGPIGSGRTDIATGIGTEFAFKNAMVRYLTLGALLEFAAQVPLGDDNGPDNLDYWPWYNVQVLIIDDIGPVIAASDASGDADIERFEELLKYNLQPVLGLLGKRHTVWVFGDLQGSKQTSTKGNTLDRLAAMIAKYCNATEKALVIELMKPRPARVPRRAPDIVAETDARMAEVARAP
jgi:hypothetical protein